MSNDRSCPTNETTDTQLRPLREVLVDVSSWCDGVRQQAEARMGVGPGDAAVIDDPVYSAALDIWSRVNTAVQMAEQLVEATRRRSEAPAINSPHGETTLVRLERWCTKQRSAAGARDHDPATLTAFAAGQRDAFRQVLTWLQSAMLLAEPGATQLERLQREVAWKVAEIAALRRVRMGCSTCRSGPGQDCAVYCSAGRHLVMIDGVGGGQ